MSTQKINSETKRTDGSMNAIGAVLLPLIRGICSKKGMIAFDVIASWAKIAGQDMARYSIPEKITFKKGEKENGILRIKVLSGAFALEISHREKFIVEKINSYFGFNAVSGIKIIQDSAGFNAMLAQSNQPPKQKILVSKEEQNYIREITDGLTDSQLKDRLVSLGEKIFNRNRR